MNPSMTSRRPRWAPILVVVAVAAATIVAVPSVREPVLRAAGWALIVNEPVAPADIIVIVPGGGGAEALEAADLVQSGIATRVAVFADPPSGEDHEFIRRGLPYEDAAARQIDQLKWLGVTDVAQIPRADTETEGVAEVLSAWCDQHRFRSIVFVAKRELGNPGGSPEATRRAFNKRFLLDLAEDWQQHGREVFKRVRRESPAAYLKVCAMLVPREMKVEHRNAIKAMSDEQIEAAIEAIEQLLAARAG